MAKASKQFKPVIREFLRRSSALAAAQTAPKESTQSPFSSFYVGSYNFYPIY